MFLLCSIKTIEKKRPPVSGQLVAVSLSPDLLLRVNRQLHALVANQVVLHTRVVNAKVFALIASYCHAIRPAMW